MKVENVPVYCLNLKRAATATTDHLGRTTCECGETVKPVVVRQGKTT